MSSQSAVRAARIQSVVACMNERPSLEAWPKTQAPSVVPEPGIKRQSCKYAANRHQGRKQGADMHGDNRLGVVTISHESGAHPHKREIGDGSGHQELEERLRPPDIASLAHAELHQPRQPMFGGLP